MLTEFEIRNLQTMKKMIDEIKDQRNDAEKGLKEIDEKYKAIIDKEKKELRERLSSCKKEIEFWEKPIIKRYGKPIDELLAKPEDIIEAEPENVDPNDELPFIPDEEKVVDTEAVEEEEKNEEPVVAEPEPEPVVEEPVTVEEPAAEINVEEEDWETETESKANSDDDWPEFPQEWK